MTKKKNTKGGKRNGAGRKPLGDKKRVKTAITMTPEHFRKTAGKRSFLIEQGLKKIFE